MTVLSDMTEDLQQGKQPDLRSLSNYVVEQVNHADAIDWEGFRETVMTVYDIDDLKFRQVFTQPAFTNKGKAVDDFRPMMQRLGMSGFLRRYVDHLINTESPSSFHFASALTILGSSLKRQCWFDQKIFKIWPAVQTLILGPSGKVAKTTATTYAMQMGLEAGVLDPIAEEITPEQLKSELAERTKATGQATGIIYASELALLFSKVDSYNQGLIQSLTDLFDSRDFSSKHTKTQGKFDLKEIAVSFLACSNEGWASTSISDSALGGGMVGRCLTFYQGGATKAIPFPEFPDPAERQALIRMLNFTQHIRGEFTVSKAARAWYEEKYVWLKENWPDDERVDPMWTRYGVHLLRLGMLFSVNDIISKAYEANSSVSLEKKEIQIGHLEMADAVLMYICQYIPIVYQFLGISKEGEITNRVVRYIARKGGFVTNAQLGRAMSKHMTQTVMKAALIGLVSAKTIKLEDLPEPHIDGSVGYRMLRKMEEI